MTRITQWQHNLSDYQIDEIFQREMTNAGLDFRSDDLPLKVDGKTHYVRCTGRSAKNRNSKSGWYCAHYGVYPKVSFGWLHGKKPTFLFSLYEYMRDSGHTKRKVLTEEEIEQQEKERLKKIRLREIQEKELNDFSRALTIIEYVRSTSLSRTTAYIESKRFNLSECQSTVRVYNRNNYTPQELRLILDEHCPAYNTSANIRKLMTYQEEHIKYRGDNLLVVGQTLDEQFVMFQLIFNKRAKNGKNKHFPKNTVKHNTFTLLGDPVNKNTKLVIICEGWATGISIKKMHPEATVLIAWDSGNMVAVAMQIRARYPKCKIYSANDNDHTKPDDDNAGMLSGEKLASMMGAYIIPPPFDSNDPLQADWSDWNDIDLNYPFDIACEIFNNTINNAVFVGAQFDSETMFEIVFDENEPLEYFNAQINPTKNCAQFSESIALNTLGLHFAFDSLEKYKDAYFSCLNSAELPLVDAQTMEEYNYERKVIAVAIQFQTELMLSSKPLLLENSAFKKMFDHIFAYNKTLANLDLMPTIHAIIACKYGEELAKSSLIYFGVQLGFYRDQFSFIHAIMPELAQIPFIRNLQQDLLFNVLLNVNEYDFWQYSSRAKRESSAIEYLLDAFAKIEIKTTSQV